MSGGRALVVVRDLSVELRVASGPHRRRASTIRPVDRVSLDIPAATTLGLVGESGCGKSTLGRALLRLGPVSGGRVTIDGVDWTALSGRRLRAVRGQAQMIFQDPYASFDPRRTLRAALAEPVRRHGGAPTAAATQRRVSELLALLELDPALADRLPHECSGGQLQRVAIARALAVGPVFLVADEPTSALDVSVQAQIMNVLAGLQDRLGLGSLFISHNLAVVRQMASRVAVMYLGRLVEVAGVDDLFDTPRHPYTRALLSAVPVPDPPLERRRERIVVPGDVPTFRRPPPGCRFHPRCPSAMDICRVAQPDWADIDGHQVACHLYPPTPQRA